MRLRRAFWTVRRLKAEQRVHCGPDVSLIKDQYLSSIFIIKLKGLTILFDKLFLPYLVRLVFIIRLEMINIPMQEFLEWFQLKMDRKYAMKMQSLKRSFIFFYNLSDQVISLYQSIRLKMEKYTEKEEYNDVMTLLNRSLLILAKFIQPMPVCLDSLFFEKFIRTFEFHINLLCTLYHSLNHYQIINKESRWQKQKIVEGINKMYTIHLKIKELCKNNGDMAQTLELISNYKKIFNARIASITNKLESRQQPQQHSQNFEFQALEFYEALIVKVDNINQQPEAKKSLMRVYFQLMHQLYSAQGRLEVLIEGAMKVSSELKGRKKNISFVGQESSNQLIRWVNIILKPNISLKHLKKLKVDDLLKAITTVLQEKDTYNYLLMQNFENNQEEIQALINLIIDVAKEIDKIEAYGLMGLISEYKEGIMPGGSKKFISQLIQYQAEMSRFYSLHQETKQLQKYVQSIVLEELGEKVNIIIDENKEFPTLQQPHPKQN